jgi:redox-sensitive bicupin YhaK (pirin superfamily)
VLAKAYPVMRSKMKKKIRFNVHSQCAWLDEIKVQHVLPNKFARTIGPFVFLEHILSFKQSSNESHKGLAGNRSHACRGIAKLTYILAGEVEHIDSIGNHIKLNSGDLHWMKAGKGIVHGEAVRPEYRMRHPHLSVVRFWINLPSKNKSEEPEYISLLANDIPKQILTDDAGWIKILSGEYEDMFSKIPCHSKQFLYHIQLEARKQFSTITDIALEYAAFLLTNSAVINDMGFEAGEFIGFSSEGELIEITNTGKTAVDIILFGGEPYNEPIVVEGAFVMNTPHEITQAYNDYYDGKYGQVKLQ